MIDRPRGQRQSPRGVARHSPGCWTARRNSPRQRAPGCLLQQLLVAALLASPAQPQPQPAQPQPQPAQPQLTQTPPPTAEADQAIGSPAVPNTAPAVSNTVLTRQIDQLLAAPAVARAHWGIAVAALDGRPLLELDAAKLFHPASNAKLFTTAAAMALLGPEAAVTTRVEARGPMIAGTLSGDLALVGAGDADFATDDVPYRPPVRPPAATPPSAAAEPPPLHALEAMADGVLAAGVHTITGDVIGDDTRFAWEPYPEDWAQDDLLWGYGAPVTALSVHDNQVALHIHPGSTAGAPAVAAFEPGMAPWFTLDTTGLVTGAPRSGTHVGIGAVPGNPRALRVWGTIAGPAANAPATLDLPDDIEQIALPDPALFAAEALRAMLVARGVSIIGIARAQHRLPLATASLREQTHQPLTPTTLPAALSPSPYQILATATSPTLLADETATNKLSLNLHAELLLERLGERFGMQDPARFGPPSAAALEPTTTKTITNLADPASRAQGLRVLRSLLPLAHIDPDDLVLVDGSGLSTHDLVTPRAVVHLLTWASTQSWFAGWRATLPIGGVDGSLAARFPRPPLISSPLTGRVLAKTGTLGEARALSGYLICASGRTVAFSILVDNHTPGSTADRDTTDRIVVALYAAL